MNNYKNIFEKVYYINLAEDEKKKLYFLDIIKSTDLRDICERFEAVNGKFLDIRLIDNNTIHEYAKKEILSDHQRTYGISLTYGSLGCALSHILLYKHISELPRPCIIFEDDIIINNSFDEKFTQLIANINSIEYDICYFGYNDILGFSKQYINDVVSKPQGLITGLYAYIVTPNGAKNILKTILPLQKQIDSSISDNQDKLRLICSNDQLVGVETRFGSKTQKSHSCKNIHKRSNGWNKLFY